MFSDDQEVRDVSVTELSRSVSAVVDSVVSNGERVVVTKHGRPIAVIVSVGDGVDALIAGSQRFALLRREARDQLESGATFALPPWRRARD